MIGQEILSTPSQPGAQHGDVDDITIDACLEVENEIAALVQRMVGKAVMAAPARERVEAGAAPDIVIAVAAQDDVEALAAKEFVGTAGADQDIVVPSARPRMVWKKLATLWATL